MKWVKYLYFLINYGIGVWMVVFYEIDIVVYKRLLDFLWNVNMVVEF